MEITKFAPVIIPTLNRYDHFKRCLESLEQCTGANKTDVYVALDYPPSEKYVDGWMKIDEFLKVKESSNGFRKLVVFRREKNCGVGHKKSNGSLLGEYVKSLYDRYIYTEDDNEFSPCFLEYINKSLERYKDDKNVIKVCGYNYLDEDLPTEYTGNYFFSKRGNAWGYGGWSEKDKELNKLFNLDNLKSLIQSKNTYKLFKERAPQCISYIRSMLKHRQLYGDSVWEIYCVLNDAHFVLPRVSMSINYGFDGSGWHSRFFDDKTYKYFTERQFNTDTTFDFSDPKEVLVYQYQQSPIFEGYLRKTYKRLVEKLDIFLIRKFNYIPKSKYI